MRAARASSTTRVRHGAGHRVVGRRVPDEAAAARVVVALAAEPAELEEERPRGL